MKSQSELSEFREKWETVKLSEIVDINEYPKLQKGKIQTYVSMGDLNEYERKIQNTEKKKYKYSAPRFVNEDTLFPKMSRCLENGKTAFVDVLGEDEVAFGSTEFVVLRATERALPKYVYYTVRRPDIRREAYKWRNGTTARRQRISTDVFDNIEIDLPPKPIQKRIVAILDRLDSKIESSQQIDELADQIGQSIFAAYFHEYDDRPNLKETDKFGKVPEGFCVGTLSELVEINMGSSPKSKYYNSDGDGPPFFQGSKNFGLRYPNVEKYCSEPEKTAEEGDVLLSVRAPVGDLNRANERSCIGRGVASLTMKNHENHFLYHLLKYNKRRWNEYETGTTFNSINSSNIEEFPILIPDPKLIEEFNQIVAPLEDIIQNHFNQREIIGATRDLLLPKLMAGELGVNDINMGGESVPEEA